MSVILYTSSCSECGHAITVTHRYRQVAALPSNTMYFSTSSKLWYRLILQNIQNGHYEHCCFKTDLSLLCSWIRRTLILHCFSHRFIEFLYSKGKYYLHSMGPYIAVFLNHLIKRRNGSKSHSPNKRYRKHGNSGITTSVRWQNWRTILLYHTFISILYMFRANTCSSSGSQLY